jgi:hypothetical protein
MHKLLEAAYITGQDHLNTLLNKKLAYFFLLTLHVCIHSVFTYSV